MSLRIRSGVRDGIFPFVALLCITAVLVTLFKSFRELDPIVFQAVVCNAGEETNASYGRLMYTLMSFFLCILITYVADLILKMRGDQKILLPWLLASTAGTFLWQCMGESSWHFGMTIFDDEGSAEFVNFTRIEGVQGIPFLIIFGILFAVVYGKISFAVEACLGAFIANWYGHACLIGTYPIAKALGYSADMVSWYRLSGAVNCVLFLIIGLSFMFFRKDKKDKYMAANHLYIALGVLLCGTVMGMT